MLHYLAVAKNSGAKNSGLFLENVASANAEEFNQFCEKSLKALLGPDCVN